MRWRSAPASTVIRLTICFLLLPMILQVTFLARPAAAEKPKETECTDPTLVVPEYFPGATVYWFCGDDGQWHILDILDHPYRQNAYRFRDSSPCWSGAVNAGIAKGFGNGFGVGAFSINDCNGNPLVRPIRVHMIIKNATTGGKCADTGWKQAPSSRSVFTYELARNLPSTCGGTGNYEVLARGSLYSTTTNSWIATGYVHSGLIYLVNCCAPPTRTRVR